MPAVRFRAIGINKKKIGSFRFVESMTKVILVLHKTLREAEHSLVEDVDVWEVQ